MGLVFSLKIGAKIGLKYLECNIDIDIDMCLSK